MGFRREGFVFAGSLSFNADSTPRSLSGTLSSGQSVACTENNHSVEDGQNNLGLSSAAGLAGGFAGSSLRYLGSRRRVGAILLSTAGGQQWTQRTRHDLQVAASRACCSRCPGDTTGIGNPTPNASLNEQSSQRLNRTMDYVNRPEPCAEIVRLVQVAAVACRTVGTMSLSKFPSVCLGRRASVMVWSMVKVNKGANRLGSKCIRVSLAKSRDKPYPPRCLDARLE